jgi:hypothetical protein
MVVALVALFVASSGTAVAVVGYARNAGAVDGRSAVSASSPVARAAGRLVATASAGRNRGRIPDRFVSGVMRGGATSLTRYLRVVDNAEGPVVALAIIPGVGRLDAQCRDQDAAAGMESTQTVITFTATIPAASTCRGCSAATSRAPATPSCSRRCRRSPCRS